VTGDAIGDAVGSARERHAVLVASRARHGWHRHAMALDALWAAERGAACCYAWRPLGTPERDRRDHVASVRHVACLHGLDADVLRAQVRLVVCHPLTDEIVAGLLLTARSDAERGVYREAAMDL